MFITAVCFIFLIKEVSISECFYLPDAFICFWFANGGAKVWIKFFSKDVVFFPVHSAVLKYEAKIDLLVFWVNAGAHGRLQVAGFGRMWEKIVSLLLAIQNVHRSLRRITPLWNQRTRCTFTRVLRPWRQMIQNLRTTQLWNQRTRESAKVDKTVKQPNTNWSLSVRNVNLDEWSRAKANKDIGKRKHTYLFYGNVNCTSKAKASDNVRFSSPKWGVDPITFHPLRQHSLSYWNY